MPIAASTGVADVLLDLFILLLAAKIGDEIFKRIGQPSIIGEILAGVVVGLGKVGKSAVGRESSRRRSSPSRHCCRS